MRLSAPAKINLSLAVLGRRPDGFHEIESLVAPVTLHDTLELSLHKGENLEFSCDDASLPADDSNLVVRAARLFCARQRLSPRVRITLTKRIPHGAGLGGGSSDAAATLLGLNTLFGSNLELPILENMASELGSDVPLFLHRSPAWVRGRGEKVEPCTLPAAIPLLLLKPSFAVPTPWAYQKWSASREIPGAPRASQRFPWGNLNNDLERPVFEKFLLLAVLKQWLLDQEEVAGALMSGSGATVFAVLKDHGPAEALITRAGQRFGPHLWTCRADTISGPPAADRDS